VSGTEPAAEEVVLDVSSFRRALNQLHQSIQLCDSPLGRSDPLLHRQLRAGAIQAFEFTYELAVRMLRRQLEEMESAPIDQIPFRDLVRLGAERGLIDSPVDWFGFREKRNITAHSYDEGKAEQIYAALPAFAERAGYLLAALERLNPCT
jgi:nucleotidyltransferase substrate binding protein (TIGR01987 family)